MKTNLNYFRRLGVAMLAAGLAVVLASCENSEPLAKIDSGSTIVLIGNNLGSRMLHYGSFETEMHMRYPSDSLIIRNMCDPGDTPGFRPHSSRLTPWAFPGAEKFQTVLATNSGSEGFFEYPDEWLTRLEADVILASLVPMSPGGQQGPGKFQKRTTGLHRAHRQTRLQRHTIQPTYPCIANGQGRYFRPI